MITLLEPPKALLQPFLQAEHAGVIKSFPPRTALVQYYLDGPDQFCEVNVDLETGRISNYKELVGKQSYTDAVEMQESETACLADERVQKELKSLDLPGGSVVCIEPWTYGTDGMHDMNRRIIMVRYHSLLLYPVG